MGRITLWLAIGLHNILWTCSWSKMQPGSKTVWLTLWSGELLCSTSSLKLDNVTLLSDTPWPSPRLSSLDSLRSNITSTTPANVTEYVIMCGTIRRIGVMVTYLFHGWTHPMVGQSTKSLYWSHLAGTCRMALDRSYPVLSVYPLSSYEQSVGWAHEQLSTIM